MSDIDTIVDVSISANTTTPSRPGFGTPLFLGYHTKWPERTRSYTKPSEMVDDGFATTDPLYRMVTAALKQNPRPKKVKVGRAGTAISQTYTITITSAVQDEHVKFTLISPDGTENLIDYTILPAATTTTVATAVELLVEACSGISSSSAAAVITATTVTSGDIFYIVGPIQHCTITDTTADGNLSVDLDAVVAYDNDWYGLACVLESEINADEVASWAETNRKLFIAHSSNDGEIDGTGVMGQGWKDASYDYTAGIWSRDTVNYPAASWLGRMLPTDPGSSDWIYKKLRGVTVDTLTSTNRTNLETDNWSFYITVASRNTTQTALVASGEKIDIIVGIDWLRSEIQLSVWDLISSSEKIPYTDAGVAMITAVILGVLRKGVDRDLLDGGDPDKGIDPPNVTAPLVSEVSTADRANRLLPDVEFGARLAGAIRKTAINGTLTV